MDGSATLACTEPFIRYELGPTGTIYRCCSGWLPYECGNLLTDSIEEILNNKNFLMIADSMRSGGLKLCSTACNIKAASLNYDRETLLIKEPFQLCDKSLVDEKSKSLRKKFFLNYDFSCNLACPSCRDKSIMVKLGQEETLYQVVKTHAKAKELIQYFLDIGDDVEISITGTGDPFASPTFYNYLCELADTTYNNLSISLVTNANLMTPERLDRIKPLWNSIKHISISIDASTEKTYNIVRKQGNFSKLKENLDYMESLYNSGITTMQWWTYYTVQTANYKEIADFADWVWQYKNINKIGYTIAQRWYHNDKQYKDLIGGIDKVELKTLIEEIRSNYKDKNIESVVDFGNLLNYVKPDYDEKIFIFQSEA